MAIGRARGYSRTRTLDRRATLILLGLLLLLLILAPALVRAQGADSLRLHWTAPGDDGTFGTVAAYEVRYATFALDAGNFASGTLAPDAPAPLPASSAQRMVLRGLTRGTPCWVVVRAIDEAGNWSGSSNVLHWTWPLDNAPPAAPAAVAGGVQNAGRTIHVSWAANTEADLAGYRIHRTPTSGGAWVTLNDLPLENPEYYDTSPPPGADRLWYAVSAVDHAGNESPYSAPLKVVLAGVSAGAPSTWKLLPAYPNPSRLGEAVRMPVEAPAAASGTVVDVLDGSGQRVRRLALSGTSIGLQEVTWDGRNDAGHMCAPGVYRAWLVAGDAREFVRIARLP